MNETIRSLLIGLKRKSEFVFPSPRTGRKLSDIKRSFRKAVKEAKIQDFTFHDLRHTATSRITNNGVDAFTLET